MPKRAAADIPEFALEGRPFVALSNLLKVEGWCEHGAAAKHVIDTGAVTVDGTIERRRRCKIVAGQIVRLGDEAVRIVP